MMETILAIWKCGAAYVPVDPAYPAQRVETLLTLARPAVIVGTDCQPPPALASIPLVDPARVPAHQDAEAPTPRCRPADLAYVIFTSGSTGQPKGAMVEHRGMLNHVLAMARRVGPTRGARSPDRFALLGYFGLAVLRGAGVGRHDGDLPRCRDPPHA